MKKGPRTTRRESGYALMLAVFLTALLLLTTLVAAPSIRTERQREKEEEMIWRGKQYVRAIKLYYRKNGRFPTSMEDLTKPKLGSLRFLRQAYKDPMNKEDGTWRLIYVGPAGQLIGSLKPPQTLQLPGVAGTQPGTPGAALGGFGTQPGAQQGTNPAQPVQPAPGTAAAQPGATPPGAPGKAQDSSSGAAADGSIPDASALAGDTPTIIGGNIIGVGSKINKRSVIIYEKGKNYRLFEFVWDPSKDALTIGGQPGAQGIPVGTPSTPGQGPGQGFGGQGNFGAQPGNPTNNPAPAQNMPPLTPNTPPPQP